MNLQAENQPSYSGKHCIKYHWILLYQ